MTGSRLHQLAALGQSVWIDVLSRDLVAGGGLARAAEEDAVTGVTSNPTIFQKALAEGTAYDAQMRALLDGEEDDAEVFIHLAVADIIAACDVLRPVWRSTGGRDGFVSLEVDPRLAHHRDATVAQATRLHELVDRPNALVKIPATLAGLGAIEEMIARGRSINVTLIFSLTRYREVAEAYLRGLERLVADGGDPSTVASTASFFVSRVDTEADRRLDEVGGHDHLKGRLAVANAKLAYQDYLGIFSGERWEALRARGAATQRCLWASTSTKNPAYRDVLYVEELIGADTVNTMPAETIRAFQDHGVAAPTLTDGVDDARRVMEAIAAAGVDYDDVTRVLEEEGVQKFEDSFNDLIDGISRKRAALRAA
ncbi:MAG: transaldolase [Actinomycetota bacterium]